ncbi:DUF1491 family protein [Rhizobium sp. SL86]|uniref:DUF1491 family protein n=1 Tax=Rhizobium sp. SL86 TaxID=2995148 RepID=UPI002274A673|nr:DUF1491 family protein [Rhizobium sp. SL86]MCY1664205.1 DUF1491 family protein [Rhizobium sp. SL86]
MRLRSDIFVSALTRRVFSMGGFAAVERRGADQAGAIFIRLRHRDGTEDLFGPAPQMLAAEEGGRRFERRLRAAQTEAVEALMARELRFDSDLWLIELDIEAIGDLFEVTAEEG